MRPFAMIDNDHILISLNQCHAKNIYAGTKQVELRRRTMHIAPGSTIWIYEKVPVGAITGYAIVKAIKTASPQQLWNRYSSVAGLQRAEFFEYFANISSGCAIELGEVGQLKEPVRLEQLRKLMSSFQPPQFFARLSMAHPVFKVLNTSSKNSYCSSKNAAESQPILLVA
jgi:predicted transcriptional regulator